MKSLEHSPHSTSEVTRYLPFSHSIPLSVCVCAEFMIWKFSLSWVPLISVETYTVRTSEQSKRFFISIETPGWQHCRGKPRIPRRRGHQLYKFARFSEKLNEIKKCLVRRRGASPRIRHCIVPVIPFVITFICLKFMVPFSKLTTVDKCLTDDITFKTVKN